MSRRGGKTGGRDFVKNDPRRQNGATPLPPEIKEIRALTRAEFILRFQKYCFATVEELRNFQQYGKMQALDMVFIRALLPSIKTGEYHFISECMDRLLGRVRQNLGLGGEKEGDAIKTQNLDLAGLSVIQLAQLAEMAVPDNVP